MLRGVHPQMGWNQKWKFDKSFLLKGFRTNLTELKEGFNRADPDPGANPIKIFTPEDKFTNLSWSMKTCANISFHL